MTSQQLIPHTRVSPSERKFRNLRISLTASCNYACTYCVPDGKRLMKLNQELSTEELLYAVRLLKAAAGITKIRLTGGEPLLSNKFDPILTEVSLMGFSDVSFTTNGQFLLKKLQTIKASGIKRINLSLDSLQPSRFKQIARGGDLETVLSGLEAVLDAGIQVKINMVPIRNLNHDEIIPMLDFSLDKKIELRYIELMKMGHLLNSPEFDSNFFGMGEIMDLISTRYEFSKIKSKKSSTSQIFSIKNKGTFGVIANTSHPFCADCNRLRITSNGRLYGCLSNAKNYDLRPILNLPFDRALEQLKLILPEAIKDKRDVSFSGEKTVMKFIGG